ncbi:F0F1 ATP synthase subunit B/delta [Williamsia serinedens]|uniref:Multifunctional fusion protein n=1 Tax=Williamsia serinedens TaxID=391736 RepID=A0ABT1H6N0_9NOCA|nr:F0F1 ATP synthase subunit B/delta [Williamsia serinedens]MCP2162885.1 F-type H+-transporting ATPase subunit delta [Williamsia serinedens]
MSIVIVNLIGFVVIVAVVVRYIRPPVAKAMKSQQDAVAEQIAESEKAKKRLQEARDAHANAVEEARATASQIREEARADAQAISEELAAQADAEVARIREHGTAQVELNRANLIRGLRSDLGLASIELAGSAVREHLQDETARQESIDRVIDELETMVGSDDDRSRVSAPSDLVGLHSMRAASREVVRDLTDEFDRLTGDLDEEGLRALADELADVVAVLTREHVLRKHLGEPSDDAEAKKRLVDAVFGSVRDETRSLLHTAAVGRWSQTSDLTQAIERLARFALLVVADRASTIDDVEDELFRLGRLLVAQPRLSALLSDQNAPVDGRLGLLDSVIGGKVDPTTKALVEQTVRLLRGQAAASAVSDLAELAAARRGETVAHVIAAIEPSDSQRERIAQVLGRIYGREISTQVEVDPDLLGGLRVAIGDEVIDADVATKLARAADELPS